MTLDTLGRSRPMVLRRWAWLIGMSDESDGRLRDRARSFATPPSIESLRGARLEFDGYVPERRAIRLVADAREVAMTIKPGPPCVNPVFEIDRFPEGEIRVILAGRTLESSQYDWDGRTLWLDAIIEKPTELRITRDTARSQSTLRLCTRSRVGWRRTCRSGVRPTLRRYAKGLEPASPSL